MTNGRGKPIATIELRGGKTADRGPDMVAEVVRSSLRAQSYSVTARSSESGVVEVYSDDNIPRDDLEKAVAKAEAQLRGGRSSLRITYCETPREQQEEAPEEGPRGDPKDSKYPECISRCLVLAEKAEAESRLREAQNSITELGQRIAELEHWEAEAIRIDEENLMLSERASELTEQLATAASKREEIERDKERLKEMMSELEKSSKPIKSLPEAALRYLADFALRTFELEVIVGDSLYEANGISTESAIRRVNSLGLGEVRSAEEAIEIVRRYLTGPGSGENLGKQYDEKNGESFAAYSEAKKRKEMGESDERIKQFAREMGLGEDEAFVEDVRKKVNRRLKGDDRTIESYESRRQMFIEGAQQVLSECAEELGKANEFSRIRGEVEKSGTSTMPVYISLREEEKEGEGKENREQHLYVVEIYFPVKEGEKSTLCDLILCENLLTERIAGFVKDDVDRIEKRTEPQSKLQFYQITLPGSRYSLDEIMSVKRAMEDAVREGYNRTSLHRLGIRLNMLFDYDIHCHAAEQTRKLPQNEEQHEQREVHIYDGLNIRFIWGVRERLNALEKVLFEADGTPMKLSEVKEGVSAQLGENVSQCQLVRYLKLLKDSGRISTTGISASTKYFLAPEQMPGRRKIPHIDYSGMNKERRERIEALVSQVLPGNPVTKKQACKRLRRLGVNVTYGEVDYDIRALRDHGIVEQVGEGRATKYSLK